jgi:hypothetical protein
MRAAAPIFSPARSGVRELLRDALGADAVDSLTPRQLGRIAGVLFAAARKELDTGNPHQLQLGPDVRRVDG